MAVNKWSTREKLFLASAVASNGENWTSVSRSLKIMCTGLDEDFSQKSCAVQYGHLLDSNSRGGSGAAELPKRNKQRTNEAATESSLSVADSLMRRLTADRIQELKDEIRRDQEEYANIHAQLKAMQAGQLSEEQLQAMWTELEHQQETQRIEEMKLENRVREQRKQEMQRDWRAPKTAVVTLSSDTTCVDKRPGLMDVEDIIASEKTMFSEMGETAISQQPQQQVQTGTAAPLLSSLLKSPPTITVSSCPSLIAAPATGTNSVRATAPTITTLLTSGSIPNTNQPMITLKSSIPPNEAAQLLARPISGPPVPDVLAAAANAAQNLLSPSQSAPTLSMLLEKNKFQPSSLSLSSMVNSSAARSTELTISSTSVAVKAPDSSNCGPQGSHVSVTASSYDSNNEEVPMDIEEDITAAAAAAAITSNSGDFDDEHDDSTEEQQLMEVFKNIGNIDELDIDVAAVIDDDEVDFLKGVDDELEPPPNDEDVNFENSQQHEDSIQTAAKNDNAKMSSGGEETISRAHQHETITDRKSKNEVEIKAKEQCQHTNERKTENVKVETITSSSDDSNDNIPLAAVASLENKERGENLQERHFLKEKVESAIKNKDAEPTSSASIETNYSSAGGGGEYFVEGIATEGNNKFFSTAAVESTSADEESTSKSNVKNCNPAPSPPPESDSSDVIIIPTDDESNGVKQELKTQQSVEGQVSSELNHQAEETDRMFKANANNDYNEGDTTVETKTPCINDTTTYDSTLAAHTNTFENAMFDPPPPTTTISIVDTDDSSTADFSINTRKDEQLVLATGKHNMGLQKRISLQDITSASVKVEDDAAAEAEATLARPPMLRKLRDRDRSESPMIDDETMTTASDYSTNQRSRRRYSSTPVIDSIPNSPASSERDRDEPRESRASKKSLISIYNALQPNRNAGVVFQRAFSENKAYEEICQRPMDLITIKKNIDSGAIRSVYELQRDVMLMCQNVMMLCKTSSATFKAALNLMQECQAIREFAANPHYISNSSASGMAATDKESKESRLHNNSSGGVRVRGSSRKSQRIT